MLKGNEKKENHCRTGFSRLTSSYSTLDIFFFIMYLMNGNIYLMKLSPLHSHLYGYQAVDFIYISVLAGFVIACN